MNFSYWENKHLISKVDYTIVGGGITGLTTSIFLKLKYPNKSIRILERGMLPWGASSKNAGFACFGSVSEILSDIEKVGLSETMNLVEKRWKGLRKLSNLIGHDSLDLQMNGGYELFTNSQTHLKTSCLGKLNFLNKELQEIIGENVFEEVGNDFGFEGVDNLIKNNFEGQIDTGLMIKSLIDKAKSLGVEIFNGTEVVGYEKVGGLNLRLKDGMTLKTEQLIICSNGFAQKLIPSEKILPARAQVLITKEIPKLKLKGTFHMEEGYYYFRNVDNRVLLGGGRNLDLKKEETIEMECTDKILNQLKKYLTEVILPNQEFEIDYSWAGIMGVGADKNPIIKKLDEGVYCGVKLGGMGVAIGALVGEEISELVD